MEAKGPNFSQEAKRAAFELWKAKVPLKNIREQLQMSKRTLRHVLAAAKASPEDPVPKRKKTSGQPDKVMATEHPVSEKPGGLDAEEAAALHQWQW